MATPIQSDSPSIDPHSGGPPRSAGKYLFAGAEKLYLRGVTYGTFRVTPEGDEFPPPDVVERDFRMMAAAGVNAVRTYTAPPRWLLDHAWANGLAVSFFESAW